MQENFFSALEEFYNELYSFIIASVGNKADADDLLQTVGLKAYAARSSLRDQKKFKAWMFTIARNEIKRFYRSKENHYVFDSRDFENVLAYYDDNSLNQLIISDFLKKLPVPWSRILYLHLYGELSASEIANMYNLNSSMVRKRLYRIKKKLRLALREGEGHEEASTTT